MTIYGNEGEYRDALIRALEERKAHVQRHEDKYFSHVPDLSFGHELGDGWVETKFTGRAFKTVKSTGVTMGQLVWLKQRRERGTCGCYVLVGTPDGFSVLIPALPNVTLASQVRKVGVSLQTVAEVADRVLEGRIQMLSLRVKN